jgi:Tfp pilus assembly protein PilO
MTRFIEPPLFHSETGFLQMALQPLDAWSRRRVALTGLLVGALVFGSGARFWRASDLGGGEASHAALADAQQHLGHSREMAARLPAMRAQLGQGGPRTHWSFADALHEITTLAAQSGLRIGAIEPSPQTGEGLEAERPLRFRAEGSFSEIRRFLDALEGLPRLVVPSNVQIRGGGASSLAMETTLRVFEDLPPVARAEASPRDALAVDPFDVKNGVRAGEAGAMLLVGTLLGSHRAMALVETPAGVDGFAPGQMIGDERLGRVRRQSIELARRDGAARTVAFAEDRR